MTAPSRRAAGRRVLVVTGDTLRPKMAGPAIRAFEIAKALAGEHEVVLASTVLCELSHPGFRVTHAAGRTLRRLEQWCDIVVLQGAVMRENPWMYRSSKVIVVDVYDPFHLEQLEQSKGSPDDVRRHLVRQATVTLNEQLHRGDFFMCASERQRSFWLGQLAAVGRVNPATYDQGRGDLERLLRVVPFGVGGRPPEHARTVLKGVVPGIGPDDKVILWGGGIYNWLDPLTLVHAVDRLRVQVPEVRLFFLGMRHPNPDVPAMQMAVQTRELSERLGLTGTHVFFNEDWVDYDERGSYLLESDVGVSTHFDHIETEFSFRTRILDYFWASLPVVATSGDALADVLDRSGAGTTVPAGDVDALASALGRMLVDDTARARARAASVRLADEFRWENVLAPLLAFCRDAQRAADAPPDPWPGVPDRRSWRRAVGAVRAGALRAVRSLSRS
ncbi:MAG: glycosyltransferase [Actinomycetota bacterium]